MATKTNQTLLDKIEPLYFEGKLDKEIAKTIGIAQGVVSRYLRQKGLESNYRERKLETIDDKTAKCKECKLPKPITEFQYGRKGTPKEYRFSYCNECRNKKTRSRVKSDIKSYLIGRLGVIKRRNPDNFNITIDYVLSLWNQQQGKCFYTDYLLTFGSRKGLCRYSLSIDKIVPEKGYTKGNIVLCSFMANSTKADMSLEEMEKWLPTWYQKLKTNALI